MPSVTCAGCGHTNAGEARFCEQCGSSLAPRCASCGAELSPTARFCSSCGSPVAGEATATEALKVVSVVFSDLVGSTALQEKLEPESVRRVMARFYEAMREIVERHGGAIQKFIGDAVVAVFGVPSVSEDDALRAARCAAAMTAALAELNDELEQTWGIRLQIRTAVNTGELAISDEGIFVGDTMNTAARLEQAADAGQVLLGEATWRLVRHELEVEEIVPLEVKGKTEPIRVWRLVSTQPRGPAAAEAPLVGRASELDRLRSALDQAIAARACRLVTVIGSPGLGKSRLASEFALALGQQATVLEGHCEATGEGITFLPVADVLRSAASIADDDSQEQVIGRLTETLPDGPDRERVVARVAGLLGAGAPAAPEETFWGVRTMLESLARDRPLVVVLDDVHWGQPMFLDLIEHLVEWARDAAILLVALARPELRELRGALAAVGRRAADVIELDPLEPDQSRELVGGLLGQVDVPDELLGRILETTEGNPLFLGELLRMLVEEGSLERDGEVWVAAGGAEAVHVPPTIHALLTARIERLRADERSVVERAAVIGKQFYRGAVAELVAPPVRSGIDGHLETLRRKDMVEPEGTYWIDEPVYRFHHVLIRDAAYHLLLKEARAELHEKFADWLETKAGELVGEHEEVIAYHLEQAHEYRRQLGPLDERGRAIGTRAATMFASAGRRALAREDLAAAANLLQRALDRDPEADVLWDLAEALLSAGDTGQAAEVIASFSGPRGDVLAAQLAVLTGSGSLEDMLDRVTAATSALEAAGDDAAEAKGHHVTAQVQAQLGRVADVETSLDKALLAARKADDRRRITAVLAAAPRAALWGPSPVVRASGRCLDVVRILRMTPGNRHVEAVALRCQAVLEAMRGRADAAREILAGGRATLEELGLTLELHELAMHAGIVELVAGQPDAAEELLRGARDGFAGIGVSVSAGQAAALLARALVEQGRDEEALTETEYAEEHAGGDLKTTITWLGVRAEALARSGEMEAAVDLVRHAVNLAEPTDALADKADANMALARVLREAGQPEEARRAADAARGLYASKDHAVGVQRASELASVAAPARGAGVQATGATIDDPEVAAHFARYVKCWEERDAEGLVALYADDYINIDHRELGWGERTGREANLKWARSALELSPDLRIRLDKVIASAPGVFAITATWRGHSAETGGEGEIAMGRVTTLRDGKITRVEIFEPDAEISMRACFEDLRGRMLLGDHMPERLYARFIDCFGRHDSDGLAEIWSSEVALIDHRQVAWEELHGLESMLKLAYSAFQMAHDIRCVVDEVIACDDRVMAMRSRYVGSGTDGGGEIEIPAGTVNVTERGQVIRTEWFDHDDREGMLARYRELGGTLDVLGDRPPERLFAEFVRRFNAHDLNRLIELYHEDWTLTDHRQFGSEVVHGPRASLEPVFAASPDVRVDVEEVIACDDRVIALQEVYCGTGSEAAGGEFELRFGLVSVVENGRARSTELFDPDDRIAIMARWRELHGLGLLGDRPSERFLARWIECYGRRDADGIAAVVDEDLVFVDRRSLAWEEQHGRQQQLEVVRSSWAATRVIREVIDEVLACDDRLWAGRTTYLGEALDGGGELEVPVGYVFVFSEKGLRRSEGFEHDDTAGMLARYRELGGTLDVLGDRPPERWWAEFKRRFDAHDLETLPALYAEGFRLEDHRRVGMEPLRGPAGATDLYRSGFAASGDARIDIEEVMACDERVVAVRATYRGTSSDTGGEFELPFVSVTVIEDGLICSSDVFDPDDRIAIMARYRELHGLGLLGDRPVERLWAKWIDCYARKDIEGILEVIDEDYTFVDRRSLGWEEQRGREQFLEVLKSAWDMWHGGRLAIDEILEIDEHTAAVRCTYVGAAAEGGGPMEIAVGYVTEFTGHGFRRVEQFEHDDTEGMLARYRELGGTVAVLGGRPPERLIAEHMRRFNRHEPDRVAALATDDFVYADHRPIPIGGHRGRESYGNAVGAVLGVAPDIRMRVEEVLACDDHVIALRAHYGGTNPDGGGAAERSTGEVWAVRDGRLASLDHYEPDDRQTMIARYVTLGGGLGALGDRPAERILAEFAKRYARRELGPLLDIVAEDIRWIDHRSLSWEPTIGRDGLRALARSGWEATTDIRIEVDEMLAVDERVLAYRFRWVGQDPQGGEFEVPAGQVARYEDGRCVSIDQYDADDRDAMLARFAELGGQMPAALDDRPPERWTARFTDRWRAGDWERLLELYAEDARMADHRSLPFWEPVNGLEGWRTWFEGVDGMRTERRDYVVDEQIACDDRVFAARVRWTFTVDGADGELEGGIVVLVENGVLVSLDVYEPDDRRAMIARYAELGGGVSALGATSPELWWREYAQHYAARDRDAVVAMHADGTFLDHRKIGWESTPTVDQAMAIIDGAWAATSDMRIEVDDVLASDERVCALRITWRGTEASYGGTWEIPMGVLSVIEDGRSTHYEMFEHDDRDAMLTRYAELGGTQALLGDRPPERAYASAIDAFNRHDREAVAASYADDVVVSDRRSMAWEPMRGRDAVVAFTTSAWELWSPAVQMTVQEVLACDDLVIALVTLYRGPAAEGGGDIELSVGHVRLVRDGQTHVLDFFEPDDRAGMIARYAELGGGVGPLGDRPPERVGREWIRAYGMRDLERIAELAIDDFLMVDHRGLGWEEVRGREAWVDSLRSGLNYAVIRVEVDEVLACDERVIALILTWCGTAVTDDGGGPFLLTVGQVSVVENGKFVSVDQYEPDDRETILARYRELGGRREAVLGDREPERLLADVVHAVNAGDQDGAVERYADDWVLVDHRQLGWESERGREGAARLFRTGLTSVPNLRFWIEEVIACDDRVVAGRNVWTGRGVHGSGEFSYEIGVVSLVEAGRFKSTDVYEPDDRASMIARYAELGGGQGPLGDRPAERLVKENARRFAARDLDGLAGLVTDALVMVDHRGLGWEEIRGRDAWLDVNRSAFAATVANRVEVREVLACDDRVIAGIISWCGTASADAGGGAFEVTVGQVTVVEDGRFVSIDQYDPDDREAMLARFEELGGRGEAAPRSRPPERLFAELVHALNGRDWGRALDHYADDWVLVDHRRLGWETERGREGAERLIRTGFASVSNLRYVVEEVLACDDRVIVARHAWTGGGMHGSGEFSYEVGVVNVVEAGRVKSTDVYEPDDRQAMIARYAELGGGLGKLGDTAPERLFAKYASRFAARDLGGLLELMSEDFVQVDHRKIGWTELDKADNTAAFESVWKITTECRVDVDEVLGADDNVFLGICVYRGSSAASIGGGQFEYPVGFLFVVEGARCPRVEWFDPEDRDAMLARYAELRGEPGDLGDRAPERFWAEFARRWAMGDPAKLSELIHEDMVQTDRRSLALWGEVRGRAAMARFLATAIGRVRDPRWEVREVLACDEEVIAMLVRASGTAEHGVEYTYEAGHVAVVRDGLCTRTDVYDLDDRAAMIARYVELGGGLGELGESPPERLFAEYARRYARRDLDATLELMSDDYVQVDHRKIGWSELNKEQNAVALRSVWEGTSDCRVEMDEVLAADDRVMLGIGTYRGSALAAGGGGRFEYPVGFLFLIEGERCPRVEWFEPDDRDAMLARYRELSEGDERQPEALRLGIEVVKAWNAHDADRAAELFAEDVVMLDHRALGAEPVLGQAAIREFHRIAFEVFPESRQAVNETLACDDRVIAYRVSIRGTSPDAAGGEAEVALGGVDVFEGGKLVRVEFFEPDDPAGILARYAELGGGQGLLGARPPERWWASVLRAYAKGDVEQLVALYADDYEYADHRQLGWEAMHGRTDLRAFWASALAASSIQYGAIDEVLGCDERVIALRVTWHGRDSETGGEFSIRVGNTSVIEAGVNVRQDQYEYGDTEAMLARYAELSAGGGSAQQLVAEYLRLIEARDIEAIRATLADEIEVADHRAIAAPPGKGPEAALELTQSALGITEKLRFEIEEVVASDERAVAYRGSWIGTASDGHGELTLPMALVVAVKGKRVVSIDLFEPDDRLAIVARYAELGGGVAPLGDRPPERQVKEYVRRLAARDLDGLVALHDPSWVLIDHRQLGWEEIRGVDAALELIRSGFDLMADIRLEVDEVLAVDDHVIAMLVNWRGSANEGGGEMTIPLGLVIVVESGRAVRHEQYEPEDRDAILARFRELTAQTSELRP